MKKESFNKIIGEAANMGQAVIIVFNSSSSYPVQNPSRQIMRLEGVDSTNVIIYADKGLIIETTTDEINHIAVLTGERYAEEYTKRD